MTCLQLFGPVSGISGKVRLPDCHTAATFSARNRGFIAAMQIFVPYSDDLAENYPDLVTRLSPYQPGMQCAHLAVPEDAKSHQAPGPEQGLEEDLPRKDAAWARV